MDKEISTTGVNVLKKFKYPVVFLNNTCPMCGGELILKEVKNENKVTREKQDTISNCYVCSSCTFCCPIRRDTLTNTLAPVYDGSITNFIDTYGDPITETMMRVVCGK